MEDKTTLENMVRIIGEASETRYAIFLEQLDEWPPVWELMGEKSHTDFDQNEIDSVEELFEAILGISGVYEDTGFDSYEAILLAGDEETYGRKK